MTEPARAVLITGGAVRLGAAMALAVARDGFDVAIHCHRSVGGGARHWRGGSRRWAGGRRWSPRISPSRARWRGWWPRRRDGPGAARRAGEQRVDVRARPAGHGRPRRPGTAIWRPICARRSCSARPSSGSCRRRATGLIVNMLDQRVLNLTPNFLSYSISQMGLWAATQVLARELAPRVRVNAIGPGPTLAAPGMSQARVRGAVPGDAAAARHQPGGDRGGAAVHHRQPVHDRPADHARRRPAAGLADAGGAERGLSGAVCQPPLLTFLARSVM